MGYVAIRRESNGLLYMDKYFFDRNNDESLKRYNYTKVEAPDDCMVSDFNDDLTFSVQKYKQRKQEENNRLRLSSLKQLMSRLSEDIIQHYAGAVIANIDEKLAEFRSAHNEARMLEGKEPREYNA